MPPNRENIHQQHKICLMLCTRRKFKAIEIDIRDTKGLSLPTIVRPHRHVAISSASESRVDACGLAFFRVVATASATLKGMAAQLPFFRRKALAPVSIAMPLFS